MYPYNFKPQEAGIKHNKVFVVMPFDEKYDALFTSLIEPATKKANEILGFSGEMSLEAYRTKDDIRTTSGWINVLEYLFTSQIIIGVLTDYNPNVFYELGIAHATEPITRQILIADKNHEPTFDTKDLIYYKYDSDNLNLSIEPLAAKVADAINWYKIEEERVIQKTRRFISPYGLDVTVKYGKQKNFHLHMDKADEYESTYGKGAFEKHLKGLENLCQHGLLGLNTKTIKSDGSGVHIEYSYYWTNLGNDLLFYLKIIDEKELKDRRVRMPESF
ncbi:MAG: hypothetical protein AB1488_09515 [Nitrospirota bacterium]